MTRFCVECKARELGYESSEYMFEDLIWKQGKGQEEIAKLFGVRQGSVSAMIRRSGVKPRSRGRVKRNGKIQQKGRWCGKIR